MWTYFFFSEGEDMCIIYLSIIDICIIDENIIILPYYWLIDLYAKFFFHWVVTFAKVECCQITETCGMNWEDSVMVELI